MEIVYLRAFVQDVKRIQEPALKRRVSRVIDEITKARTLRDIKNIRKLEGHRQAYRIRVGNYRIGLFLSGSTIELARIVDRKDIYRFFP